MNEAAHARTVDSIYDAATSHSLWPEALGGLGRVFGACVVSLIERDFQSDTGRAVAWGIDLDGQKEFIDTWGTRNVFVARTLSWRTGRIETDRDILPKDELLASDYYNGFMKPRGMRALMRLTLEAGTGANAGYNQILSLARPASAGEYEPDDVERFRLFTPHLLRASRIARHVEQAQVMLDGLTGLLEQSPAGILLLDGSGKVVFANHAARALAAGKDAFALRHNRIEASNRRDDAVLQSLISRAASRVARADQPRAGGLRLTRNSGKPGFHAVVAPLARASGWRTSGPAAFVLITDPADVTPPSGEILAQLFGLTRAETRVAQRLAMGDSPEQAAAALDIGISTARWHLGSLYRKTGTSRQAELVRFLLCLPAMGAP